MARKSIDINRATGTVTVNPTPDVKIKIGGQGFGYTAKEAFDMLRKNLKTGLRNVEPMVLRDVRKSLETYQRNDLAREITKLDSMANKRIKRLEQWEEKTGLESRALNRLRSRGIYKFSVAGKDVEQLSAMYDTLISFLASPLSTIKGVENSLLAAFGGQVTVKQAIFLMKYGERIENLYGVTPAIFDSDFWQRYRKGTVLTRGEIRDNADSIDSNGETFRQMTKNLYNAMKLAKAQYEAEINRI